MADTPSLDRWTALGLYDPHADGAAGLAPVLEFYESVGIDPADFAGCTPETVVSEVNLAILVPGRRFTRDEVVARSGAGDDEFVELCRAAGYDPDGMFSDIDISAFESFVAAGDLFTAPELLHFVRVLSASMANLADATTSLFRIDVLSELDRADASELDYAISNHDASQMKDVLFVAMQAFFLRRLLAAVRRGDEARRAADMSSTSTVQVAIGFVDLAGFTSMSEELSADELGHFMVDFESRCNDVVAAHDGRIVKLIGDEVMFMAVEAETALTIARDLVAAYADTSATPRGGVIRGEVVSRGGDYYGSPVNLAARIVDQAVPGEILTDAGTAEMATGMEFENAGRRQLKGFADPVALRSLL